MHPCRGEAYGLTIAEAMACGLPVVVPDRGAARDFTDSDTALLVPARQIELPASEASSYRMDRHPVVNEVDPVDLAATTARTSTRTTPTPPPSARGPPGASAADHTWDRTAEVAMARIAALTGRAAERLPALA